MADDKKTGLERSVADLETAIEEMKDGIATAKSEIESLGHSIKVATAVGCGRREVP